MAKANSVVDYALLSTALRDDFNERAERTMAVPALEGRYHQLPRRPGEYLEGVNNPQDPATSTRQIPFTREIYIEREDLRKIRRRSSSAWPQGGKCALRFAYFIKCT